MQDKEAPEVLILALGKEVIGEVTYLGRFSGGY